MIRKGRTLGITVDELLESVRLKLAVRLFEQGNEMALKAILIELGLECLNVARVNTTKKAVRYKNIPVDDMYSVLRDMSPDDFNTFNIYWGLSKPEQEAYLAEINNDHEAYDSAMKRVIERFSIKEKGAD